MNSTVNHKHCELQQSFAAFNGENMVLRPNNILLKAHILRYQPQIWNNLIRFMDFLAGLEFNMFHKIYILYKILFINHFHKLKPV